MLRIQTRPSILYARLFAALGDFAKGVEVILLVMAIGLGVILLPAALHWYTADPHGHRSRGATL